LIELATGALFILLATLFAPGTYLYAVTFFSAVLVLIAIIDVEKRVVLDVVVIPATVLALFAGPILRGGEDVSLAGLDPVGLWVGVLGAGVGYLISLVIYFGGSLFRAGVNRGRPIKVESSAFGRGDVKLCGLVGALVGFPATALALLVAVVLVGAFALGVILWQLARRRGYSAFTALPYGPFIAISGWAFMLWGQPILAWLGVTR
jgi:leader peptidase (prepilin peptidase)/N-methyltransferase